MKKHITIEQLQEIDFKKAAKTIFDDEVSRQYYILGIGSKGEVGFSDLTSIATTYNIGKMIEILENKYPSYKIGYGTRIKTREKQHRVTTVEKDECHESHKSYEAKELCDALWKAVKYVLREEE